MSRDELLREIERCAEVAPGTLRGPEELSSLPGWDSMTQLTLVVNVERAAGIRCAAPAVADCHTVQDLLDLLTSAPPRA